LARRGRHRFQKVSAGRHRSHLPIRGYVIGMGEKYSPDYASGSLRRVDIHGRRQFIGGEPLGHTFLVLEQKEAVASLADDLRRTSDVIPNLLKRELLIIGHGCDDLA